MHHAYYQQLRIVRWLFAVLVTLAFALPAHAQKSKLKLAKNYYDQFDFQTASEIYADILSNEKTSKDTTALRMGADCARKLNQFGKSEGYLRVLMSTPSMKKADYHDLGEVLRMQGKYPEAIEIYQRILLIDPYDPIALLYAERPNFADDILRDSMIYFLRNSTVNSTASDFAPGFFTSGKVIFASSRGQGVGARRDYAWNHQSYLNIFTAEIASDTSLVKESVLSNEVNSRYHEGTISYDPGKNLMYFTRNNYYHGNVRKSSSGRLNLGIFTAKYSDGAFGELVPFAYNDKEYSVGHPSISASGSRIYFTSDKPGGMGGTDIYYCDLVGNQWSAPKNAGPRINTVGNEMFPYAVGDSVLYFSSTGHIGLGGLDIFYIDLADSTAAANNMGYPVNSHHDDFGTIVYPDEAAGYFCSDRPGGKGDDDIYEFFVQPPPFVEIKGRVVGYPELDPIESAVVTVPAEDGSLIQVLTEPDGSYTIMAPYRKVISLEASKQDYIPAGAQVTTNPRKTRYTASDIVLRKVDILAKGKVVYDADGAPAPGVTIKVVDESGNVVASTQTEADGTYSVALPENQKITLEVEKAEYVKLTQEVDTRKLTGRTVNNDFRLFKLEKGTVVRLDNIYYDYNKSDIRPDAALELNKLVQILNNNPTMKIELSSHTDSRGSDSYNLKLSDARAKSAVKYIISQGIDPSRVVAKGYGETKLLNRCDDKVKCSEEEHQFNRRTEFKILDI